LTDGRADDPDLLKDVIVEMAQRLDEARAPPFQCGVQFLQVSIYTVSSVSGYMYFVAYDDILLKLHKIGDDEDATDFLRELDDDLKAEAGVRDMVDTVPWRGVVDGTFILNVLLGAVNRRIDRRNSTTAPTPS
jgi:hypothetical protein